MADKSHRFYPTDTSDKSSRFFKKYSFLPIGGLLLPITLHGIHLLLPIFIAGSAGLASSHSHMNHQDSNMMEVLPLSAMSWLPSTISVITILSAAFTLWYIIRLWTHKDCSRRWAWIYSGIAVACFGVMAIL
jgi:hypothetical protein